MGAAATAALDYPGRLNLETCNFEDMLVKKTDIVDSTQKKKDPDKEPQSPSYQQLSKSTDKQGHINENQNVNVPVSQHVPAQQLLSPSHGAGSPHQPKDDSKDKTLLKVANSTTITLIENGTLNGDKDKDYPKNYFTLEPKTDKKDDSNKNSITITKTVPKQSPGGQVEKTKGQAKQTKRPLQYLETLAEKAGITFEDKYEAANTLLALDKQNNVNRPRPPELKQPKTEPDNHSQAEEYNRYRNQKEEDDKLQIQQQIIQQQQQQQQQQQLQQLQQLQQQQLQHLQQQALQRQHQQVLQQHIKNQQDQQELLQKQFHQQQQHQQQQQQQQQQQHQQQQQQQKPELLQVAQTADNQQKFLQPLHTQQFNVPGIGEINLSFLASPQNNVNLVFDKNQKTGMSTEVKPQIVDGQNQVVQQQINMSQHDSSQQHHQTVTVVSSMPNSMAHQVQQQQQSGGSIQQQSGQLASMPPLHSLPPNPQQPQQISAEWGHSRVQVIQQPLQNNAYLQQLYNAQGPLLMPGNILHPGLNSQQIQVIAAGKPFQGGQLAPHMLTQGKQVLQGQAGSFPGYTTIPAIPTTQNQTFVFSPLSVINSQPSILPAHSQATVSGIGQQKQGDMKMCGGKVTGGKVGGSTSGGQTVQAQCVQISQPTLGSQQPSQTQIISPLQPNGQPMQFAPWQISGALPQVWTGGLQAGAIPAGGILAPNPTLFIRGSQPDQGPSMFIQHSPQTNTVQHNTSIACAAPTTAKPRASSDMAKGPRPLSNILPSGGIRPASSVSTQTNQAQNQAKQRGKAGIRSPAPAAKQDAANQTNKMQHQSKQLVVMGANGQMTQITTVNQDGKPLTKNMQQQAMMQQQMQHQQQQQLMHQQQTQQMVQHYQQQGMQMSLQQGGMPVGSVAQALPMTGMPQTISMVQQIHPLSGMTQQGTLVGQLSAAQQNAQVQAMQHHQTLVGAGMVQTSVGMAVQPQGMAHSTPINAPSITIEGASVMSPILQVPTIPYHVHHEVAGNNVGSPQLTLQTPGAVGLIATPVQGSVMPMQTMVAHVKNEEDKMPPPATTVVPHTAPQTAVEAEAVSSTPANNSASATVATVATAATTDTPSISTTNVPATSEAKTSPQKADPAAAMPEASSSVPPTTTVAPQTTHVAPQVVSTAAGSTATSTSTATVAAPVTSASAIFKTNTQPTRTINQTAEEKVSQQPAPDLRTKGVLDNIYYKGLPKAMVKPNILTHVIEGYVIQEAAEPFAVNRPLREWSTSNASTTAPADRAERAERTDRTTAERVDRTAAERNERTDRPERETRDTREPRDTREGHDKTPSTDEPPRKKAMLEASAARITSSSSDGVEAGPSKGSRVQPPPENDEAQVCVAQKWSVSEVCEFIRNIPGCASYADDFLMQEVDGEALLLIKPEHLVMALAMRLGPALKIVACIDALRPNHEQSQADNE